MQDPSSDRRGWSPFIELSVDASLRVTDWNPRAEHTFAAPRDAALGRPVAELVPAADEATWLAVLADSEHSQVWSPPGDPRSFEWWHRVHYAADHQITGASIHGREVTDRVAAEKQAFLTAQLLGVIRDNLNIALWSLDADGKILYQEGRASQPAPGALVGMNMLELFAHSPGLPLLQAAMAGEPAYNKLDEGGKFWESWMIPVARRSPDGPVLVAISLDISESARDAQELRDRIAEIERQHHVIRAMSTPIVEVWDGVLTLPIIGIVDSVRAAEIMDSLLQSVVRTRSRFAILDMTGVEVVDTSTASHLISLIRSIRLLGAEGVITGIHPNIAQTIVTLEMDLSRITVKANLREALRYCIGRMPARAAAVG